MADPLKIIRRLDAVTTDYAVFERDQVLTHEQLNSVAEYLDDQSRLTRTQLLGVGIVGGLLPALGKGRITIGKGVPMIPVEETRTWALSMPSASAAAWLIASASAIPAAPVPALALPELTITAAALLRLWLGLPHRPTKRRLPLGHLPALEHLCEQHAKVDALRTGLRRTISSRPTHHH